MICDADDSNETHAHKRRRHMAGKLFASAKGGAFYAIRRSLNDIKIFFSTESDAAITPAF